MTARLAAAHPRRRLVLSSITTLLLLVLMVTALVSAAPSRRRATGNSGSGSGSGSRSSASGSGGGSGSKNAWDVNRQAMELAQAGNLRDALPLFQRARELDPRTAEFANNLGVTYLRMSRLREAKEQFQAALDLEPGHQTAQMNLEQTEAFIRDRAPDEAPPISLEELMREEEEEERNAPPPPPPSRTPTPPPAPAASANKPKRPKALGHIRRPMPEVHIKDLYLPQNADYARGRRPFILKGALEHPKWKKAMETWSMDYFASIFPNTTVDFYPHNMDQERVRPFLVPFAEAAQELRSPSGTYPTSRTHPGAYVQWNINYRDWEFLRQTEFGPLEPLYTSDEAWLQGCMDNDDLRDEWCIKTHWRMMLIGTQGGGMFNHIDTLQTSSFQAHLVGAKTLHLCSPDQTPYMYGAGAVDCFNPDYEKYPLMLQAECFQYTVRPGDMLYYPRDWWHQTRNEEALNIAITGTLYDAHNYDMGIIQVKKQAYGPNQNIFIPTPELKDALEDCYNWWTDAFQTVNPPPCPLP